ncbi:hypothetical protein JQ031_18545 [Clostridium botulinum]|nr:hypothetical protein [Clostridium botulinum]MCS4474570.1 hypothetical protein [Clostridium botulinum]
MGFLWRWGGNFGIVTSFIFKVHPISNVAVYNITWDWSDAREIIKTWQDWAPFVDERLTSILEIFTKKDGRISSSGEFLGHEDQLRCLLKPLTSVGNPIQIEVQTIPYIEAVIKFDGGPGLISSKILGLLCTIGYLMRRSTPYFVIWGFHQTKITPFNFRAWEEQSGRFLQMKRPIFIVKQAISCNI